MRLHGRPRIRSIDLILDERARELTGETTRWFDLTRTGKLVERVQLYNPGGAPNVKASTCCARSRTPRSCSRPGA